MYYKALTVERSEHRIYRNLQLARQACTVNFTVHARPKDIKQFYLFFYQIFSLSNLHLLCGITN